jgi:hypothetical protein
MSNGLSKALELPGDSGDELGAQTPRQPRHEFFDHPMEFGLKKKEKGRERERTSSMKQRYRMNELITKSQSVRPAPLSLECSIIAQAVSVL